jgi:hypothetical protein
MQLTVSWWDQKDGLGVALTEQGVECLIHRSALSSSQQKALVPRMIIHGEVTSLASGVRVIQKIRISNKFESVTQFRNLQRLAEAV